MVFLSDVRASPIVFGPRIRISCYGAPPTSACAAFIKESRMKFANASKLDRKSGVRWGERGAPVLFPLTHLRLGAGESRNRSPGRPAARSPQIVWHSLG